MVDHEERLKAGWVSAGTSALVFGTKVTAFVLTGSAAIFSDAMESIVNIVAAGFLVWSLRIASRPADADHPYGHGKVEFFTAGLEGVLILVASALIGIQAVRSLVARSVPQELDTGVALLGLAAIVNAALGWYLLRAGRRTKSLALEADGRHVLADVWTSAGVIGGLVLVRATGWTLLDPLMALAVAAWILREGVTLTARSVAGLMDAADDTLLAELVDVLERDRPQAWIDVHSLRAWRSGAHLHADLHLVVPRFWNVEQLHREHDEVERRVASVGEGDAIAHFDPCTDVYCWGCAMTNCEIRAAAFDARVPLTVEQATRADPDPEADPGLPGGAPDAGRPPRGDGAEDDVAEGSAFEGWWEEHDELDAKVSRVERSFAEGSADQIRRDLGELTQTLEDHFLLEDQIYFPQVEALSGGRASTVRAARLAHERLREQLHRLAETVAGERDRATACADLARLIADFRAHEAVEQRMVRELPGPGATAGKPAMPGPAEG